MTKKMKMKTGNQSPSPRAYESPAVLRRIAVELETPILAGSVVDALNANGVKAAAQELVQEDASADGFNHEWN